MTVDWLVGWFGLQRLVGWVWVFGFFLLVGWWVDCPCFDLVFVGLAFEGRLLARISAKKRDLKSAVGRSMQNCRTIVLLLNTFGNIQTIRDVLQILL